MTAYDAFARRIVASGILSDPWLDGAPRFRADPVIVSASFAKDLRRAAEDVAAVYNELCLIITDEPRTAQDRRGRNAGYNERRPEPNPVFVA